MSVTVVVCIKNKQNKYKMKLSKTLKTRIDDFFNNLTNEELEFLEEMYFNKRLKTITVTHCCTELKDEEKLNFKEWLKKEKITEIKEVYYKCCGIDLSKELVDKAFKNRNL